MSDLNKLLEQATREVAQAFSRKTGSSVERVMEGAKNSVHSSYRQAVEYHKVHKPRPREVSPKLKAMWGDVPDSIRQTILSGHGRSDQAQQYIHRTGLVSLFTISGAAESTASAIVDIIVQE